MAHIAIRWKAIVFSTVQYRAFTEVAAPACATSLMTMAQRRLPEGYDVEKHFGPQYNAWDQRLCLAPDGDFFRAIRHGKADVVTDTIDRFTKTGIRLNSGQELASRHHHHRNGIEHAVAGRRAAVTSRTASPST